MEKLGGWGNRYTENGAAIAVAYQDDETGEWIDIPKTSPSPVPADTHQSERTEPAPSSQT